MKYKLLSALVCTALLTACSSNVKTDPYQGQSAEMIYAKGHAFLQKGDYSDAITAYQALDSQYPFESASQKGDLEIIYAYYQDDQPTLAIAAADRYIRLYPNGPDLDYAHYLRGVVAFDNGRGFLQRHFPYDMSQHYSSNYVSAFDDFKIVIDQYPHSPYAPDARRRMIYLNDEIANYQLGIAKFYLKREAYVAAVNRAQIVVLHYPTTPAAREALEVMISAYQALNLPDLAATAQQVLNYNTTGHSMPVSPNATTPALTPPATKAAPASSAPASQPAPAQVAPATTNAAPAKTSPSTDNANPARNPAS